MIGIDIKEANGTSQEDSTLDTSLQDSKLDTSTQPTTLDTATHLSIPRETFKMPPKQRNIAIMGYRSVGKSSLSIQFVDNIFVDSYDPTIENTFSKVIRVNNQEYEIKLVDTAGQDEYSIFPVQYSIDYHGYVLVYSITSSKSFEVIKVIYEKLLDMTGKINVPIVLVGNKSDLYNERAVLTEEGKQLANAWKVAFLETSAKQNEALRGLRRNNRNLSVADIFHTLLMEIEKADGNLQIKGNCSLS